MRTASNVIARILLIAAGGLIIFGAILSIVSSVNAMNDPAIGWWNWGNQQSLSALILFGLGILNSIIGLTALFAAIRGRRSFWLFIFALVLMITPVYTIVTRVQAGTLTGTWDQIGQLLLQFLTPIMYFVGCLLLVRPRRAE